MYLYVYVYQNICIQRITIIYMYITFMYVSVDKQPPASFFHYVMQ